MQNFLQLFNLYTGSTSVPKIEMPVIGLSLTNLVSISLLIIRILGVISLFILFVSSFYVDYVISFSPPIFLKSYVPSLSPTILTFAYANQIVILIPLLILLLTFLGRPKNIVYSFILSLLSGSSVVLTFKSFLFFLSNKETSVYLFKIFKVIKRYTVDFKLQEYKKAFHSVLDTTADLFVYKARILEVAKDNFPSLHYLENLSLGEVRESGTALAYSLYAKILTLESKVVPSQNKGGIIHFISEHKTAIVVTTIVTVAAVALIYYWVVPAIVTWAKAKADEATDAAVKKATETATKQVEEAVVKLENNVAIATGSINKVTGQVQNNNIEVFEGRIAVIDSKIMDLKTNLNSELIAAFDKTTFVTTDLSKQIAHQTDRIDNLTQRVVGLDHLLKPLTVKLNKADVHFLDKVDSLTSTLNSHKKEVLSMLENHKATIDTSLANLTSTMNDYDGILTNLQLESALHSNSLVFLTENTLPDILSRLHADTVYSNYLEQAFRANLAPEDQMLVEVINFLFKKIKDFYNNNNNET